MIFTDLPGKPEVVKLTIFHENGREDCVNFEENVRDFQKKNANKTKSEHQRCTPPT